MGAAPSANSYGQFGAQAAASAERFGAHIPFTDGTVYFDFGGSTTGTNRVIAAGLTFSQADTWVFSTGPAGMQIWQNGILRASNTANPSRTNAGGGNFGLRGNSSGGTSGDSGQWALFGYAPVQWSKDQNAAISANPWQLFAPLPRRIWAPSAVVGTPVGIATETDTALTLAGRQLRTVGIAAESATAIAPAGVQIRPAGLAVESDTAQTLAGRQMRAAGVATETDSAFSLGSGVSGGVGVATETDSALPLAGTQLRAVGLSLEIDASFALTSPEMSSGPVGLAAEIDTAFSLFAAAPPPPDPSGPTSRRLLVREMLRGV